MCDCGSKYSRSYGNWFNGGLDMKTEEEKFYLQKIKSFYELDYDEWCMFLKLDLDDNAFFLSDVGQYDNCKTQFTQREIDKIKEEQSTDLSEFRQIPMEEIAYEF